MHKNIQDLIQKYPIILGKLRGNQIEGEIDGWYDILDCLCESITDDMRYTIDGDPAQYPYFLIVKEKFAILECQGIMIPIKDEKLREIVYNRIAAQVRLVNHLSSRICQRTGRPGVFCQNKSGLFATLDLTNPEFTKEFEPVKTNSRLYPA